LNISRHVLERAHEMDHAFLASDPADEKDVGFRRIDSVRLERGLRIARLELIEIDAIVDDVHALRIDAIALEHLAPRVGRDGDHRIGALDRGALDPGRELIPATELLLLPRPERLERMRRHHERYAIKDLGPETRGHAVPGVTMHDVRIDGEPEHVEIDGERLDGLAQARIEKSETIRSGGDASHGRPSRRGRRRLLAEAADLDVDQVGELTRQMIDMHTRPSVDVGRILTREDEDLSHGRTFQATRRWEVGDVRATIGAYDVSSRNARGLARVANGRFHPPLRRSRGSPSLHGIIGPGARNARTVRVARRQIGRASCRESVASWGAAG